MTQIEPPCKHCHQREQVVRAGITRGKQRYYCKSCQSHFTEASSAAPAPPGLVGKRHQATIIDIAQVLGVSKSTVSRALTDHPDVNPGTKKAVIELATKLEYEPNSLVLSLLKRKTNIIGVIVPNIVRHFFSSTISGIEDIAYNAGYKVMMCQSNETYKREIMNTHVLASSRVDGVLVSVSTETEDFEHFRQFNKKGIPLIFFDRTPQDLTASRVMADDVAGGFQAVEHLIRSGCRRIAHLTGPPYLSISRDRRQGYLQALWQYNLPVDEDLIVPCDLTEEDAIRCTHRLLDLHNRPDGLFALVDIVAIGALKSRREVQVSVPGEMAVIGFGNEPISSYVQPSLTTVEQPAYEMGRIAAQLFLDQVKNEGEPFTPATRVLQTKLILRESSRRN
ncbi:LacI family DNA-binding transcriptional regulator [soil metagenome]